jgi:response regulator RpfG family c-di-GMP phosphodiesterase
LDYLNVILWEDSWAALEELKRKLFDLINLNWHMPKMYGPDLFKELTNDRKLRVIPFLLISAVKQSKKAVEAVAVGVKEYIVKSVKLESLANKIKEVVFGAA